MNTTTLRNGLTVLAKDSDNRFPMTFANRKQADARVSKLVDNGIAAHVTARWPFLVVIDNK